MILAILTGTFSAFAVILLVLLIIITCRKQNQREKDFEDM